ncbi:hypothetical protein [Streptomyces odonnellii]|uniref:hypothetical protein n=1 Tax=Streptomyces odonnellii TaxID=1417980 RepID=UPI000A9E11B4|nr:hypothetical protein [Streptomyces odonnellii]
MILRARKFLLTAAVGAVVALFGIPLAFAVDATGEQADDIPPTAVEFFGYPGAERILATKGIKLVKGDGHILLAECDQAPGQIKVLTVGDDSVGRDDTYCFEATARTGYLTLELPRVFALETGEHPISADLTANGATTTVEVPEDGFEPVGEGTVGGARSVLVEIRVTG